MDLQIKEQVKLNSIHRSNRRLLNFYLGMKVTIRKLPSQKSVCYNKPVFNLGKIALDTCVILVGKFTVSTKLHKLLPSKKNFG